MLLRQVCCIGEDALIPGPWTPALLYNLRLII